MPLRLIQMVCPEERREAAEELAAEHEPVGLWQERLFGEQVLVTLLVAADRAEHMMDELEDRFSGEEGFRIVLLPVAATVPEAEPEEAEEEGEEEEEGAEGRVSRQELHDDVAESARLTGEYVAMILLATLVAAIGIWRGNVAVVIGAMVLAPLLGPNTALALANALGDGDLWRRAMRTNLVGIGAGLGLAAVLGLVLPFAGNEEALLWGSRVSLPDVALALAAGAAGAVVVARGTRSALVGVMVAVALWPPLVTAGLGVGAAEWGMAVGAGLLFLTNLICINLAGIATFVVQGIRPHRYYEAQEARRAARRALVLWSLLLLAIVAAIFLGKGWLEQIVLARAGVGFLWLAAC
ncbi:MAG: TIGR00341 family protein [Candidatus Brocadiia bacterium]